MTTATARDRPVVSRRDAVVVVVAALVARLLFVAWAWGRVPPSADGTFYDTIARRIAAGLGYTWLWPDGTVTYAAHYPVGYPAFMAIGYRLFAAQPEVTMVQNAVVGALLPWAVHRVASGLASRRAALAAGLAAALHPALVSYTPALMTEGVTSALVAVAIAVTALAAEVPRVRVGRWVLVGLVVGAATFMRPQCLALAPLFPLAASLATRPGLVRACGAAALVSLVALVVLSPWTIRNCRVMDRCALVSVNGGWNLAIGADPSANGTWAELKVPEACRDVFDEAGKDACFGREARRAIAAEPLAWAALVPKKLAATFDYFGAGPGYLRGAAPAAFSETAKRGWLWAETLVQRLALAVALVGLGRAFVREAPRRARLALDVALVGLAALPHAALAYGVLALGALALPIARRGTPAAVPVSGLLIAATAAVHAVFFGAGRYGLLVIAPTLILAAAAGRRAPPSPALPA